MSGIMTCQREGRKFSEVFSLDILNITLGVLRIVHPCDRVLEFSSNLSKNGGSRLLSNLLNIAPVTPHAKSSGKVSYFAYWIGGLLIPLVAVLLWDGLPRFEAVRLLREAGVEQSQTGLLRAIDRQDLSIVKLLHRAQVPLDGVSHCGGTPLIQSIKAGNLSITDFLVGQSEVDCDRPDGDGVSPLGHAIMLGDFDAVKKLLMRIEDPNVTIMGAEGEWTHALLEATRQRNSRLLRLLLTHPAIDVNVSDSRGRSPLHHAIARNDLLVVRALFSGSRRPDPNFASLDGETPLGAAVAAGRSQAVELLLRSGLKPGPDMMSAYVVEAIESDDAETLRHLLNHGGDPNAIHPRRSVSLLEYAVDFSKLGCLLELMEAGVHSGNVLRRAIQCGEGIGAQLVAAHLLEEGVEWVEEEGLLEMALESGNPECMDLLLEYGTDPNQFGHVGQRLLVTAMAARKNRMVRRLLELGADPNLRLEHPPTKEFLAFFEGDAKTLFYLKNDRDLSPLMLAALTEQQEIVGHLLAHRASKNGYSSRYKRYAVAFAAERKNVPIMQMILGREANDESRKVVISLKNQKAVLYEEGEPVTSSRVSTGRRGYRTPTGTYVITDKHRHHRSTIYGSSMPFFMRLSCGDFGLHYSASVPSYPASHGCIRMPWSNAQNFFKTMRVGDIVVIE